MCHSISLLLFRVSCCGQSHRCTRVLQSLLRSLLVLFLERYEYGALTDAIPLLLTGESGPGYMHLCTHCAQFILLNCGRVLRRGYSRCDY